MYNSPATGMMLKQQIPSVNQPLCCVNTPKAVIVTNAKAIKLPKISNAGYIIKFLLLTYKLLPIGIFFFVVYYILILLLEQCLNGNTQFELEPQGLCLISGFLGINWRLV